MRTALKLFIAALAATALLPLTAATADTETAPAEVCEVELHIHTYPDVWVTPPYIGVQTGQYHVHQDCIYIETD